MIIFFFYTAPKQQKNVAVFNQTFLKNKIKKFSNQQYLISLFFDKILQLSRCSNFHLQTSKTNH